ncbi:MAG: DUF4124 domain-containing protein [Pseudomonadota bacterium]
MTRYAPALRRRLPVLFLLGFLANPMAALAICKWVDEDGVTHFADVCPEEADADQVELAPEPTEEQALEAEQRAAASRATLATGDDGEEALDPADTAGATASAQFAGRSLTELEQLCEAAREARLAPEREQLINECVAGGRDRGYCTRFHQDHGDPQRISVNMVRKALYYDLPECTAWKAAGGVPP